MTDFLPDLLPAGDYGRWARYGWLYALAFVAASVYWIRRYRQTKTSPPAASTWYLNEPVMKSLFPAVGAIIAAVGALERDWGWAAFGLPLLAMPTVFNLIRANQKHDDSSSPEDRADLPEGFDDGQS